MFKKPFKLKFQIQLKSTDKKKFGNDLKSLFPALTDEDIASLVSNKENIFRMKVITFKEEDVEVYCVNKVPMYIDVIDTDVKLPTVFMLWRFPHMIPTFTTNTCVLNKLKNGADLFFPGIYMEGLFFYDLDFKKNDPGCVNTVDNKAAIAVGLLLVDKDEVIDGEKNKNIGKLMKIYHTTGDYLCKVHSDVTVLQLGPPDWAVPVNEDSQSEDLKGQENKQEVNDFNNVSECDLQNTETSETFLVKEPNEPESEKGKMNELLEYCFLKALKTTPKASYPILPATFYANHVLTSLPEGENLNIKKTKWKKFSSFLQEKSLEGLVKLQQMPKNEFSITGTNSDHKRLREFVDPHKVISVVVEAKGDNHPVVQQVYSVTAATLPLFMKFGLKKHDELTKNDVRNNLSDYIKSENLVHPEKAELVLLDPILYQIIKGEKVMSRATLLAGILDKMTVQHKVSNLGNGEAILHKGKMPAIEFETCLRTGNKKVTLISNLESFGVNVANFSKELQHKAAASTTITPMVPGKKGPQIQVQGNQIAIAMGILKEKYNISDKFMKGTEKAVKSKNKK